MILSDAEPTEREMKIICHVDSADNAWFVMSRSNNPLTPFIKGDWEDTDFKYPLRKSVTYVFR